MPQAGVAIAAWWGGLQAGTQAFIVGVGLSALSTGVQALLTDKPSFGSFGDTGVGSRLSNTRSSQAILPLLYGRSRVGINQAYVTTIGDNLEHLHLIALLGEGPIHGITREDGTTYTNTATVFPTTNPPLVYLGEKLWTEYDGLIDIEFYNGASDQGYSANLHAADPSWEHPQRYTAYLYLKIKHDPEKFQGLPKITVVNDGLLIYNPVTTITEYSNNAALVAYDYAVRPSTRGGMGIDSSVINSTSLSDAITYCTTKGWTANMAIYENQYAGDILEAILKNFRGEFLPSGIEYKFFFRDVNYEATVMSLTEEDIVAGTLAPSLPDASTRPNAIRIKFFDKDLNYQVNDYVYADTEAIAEDGDYREMEVELPGLSSVDTVHPMAVYLLERARHTRTWALTGRARTLALEAMDLVSLSYASLGVSGKLLRVESAAPDIQAMTSNLTLIEEDADFYNGVYDGQVSQVYETTLPDPAGAVAGVTGVSHFETVYPERGRSRTRWTINFEGPAASDYPWWQHAEVYIKIDDGDWIFKTVSEKNYFIDPVHEGKTYYCKLRSVSIHGVKQDFDAAHTVSKTIVGKTSVPSNLSGLTVTATGSIVDLHADPIADPDIVGYEVRMGEAWASSVFVDMLLDQPKTRIFGVRPGTQTFWVAAKDNQGNYSSTPVSASCTVPYPTNYDYMTTWSWDYTTGTFTNTARVVRESIDCLQCTHTGNVLTGTWVSPTYDFGSVKRLKIYGDFLTEFVSGLKTWNGLFPSGTTWSQKVPGSKTWNQYIQTEYNGELTAWLKYGDASISENTFEGFAASFAEIDARYVAVQIQITDPEMSANLFLKELNMTALTFT